MPDAIIDVININKYYGETVRTQVLFDISLQLDKGRFTAFIGPSGSGKTTLMNILSLLDKPDDGRVIIDDLDVSNISLDHLAGSRAEKIGFVFQFHYLLPEFTALENVVMPARLIKGFNEKQVFKRGLQLLERLGVGAQQGKFPSQMSGGQQQRVAIARSLINAPALVFADEPTGNLDRKSGEDVLALLREMVQDNGATLIMVTHDRDIALTANRIIELVDGRICRDLDVSTLGSDTARQQLSELSCSYKPEPK